MIAPTLHIPAEDLRRMDQLLADIQTVTNRDMGTYIERAMVMALVSARKATPKAKKRQQINLSRSGKKRRSAMRAPWWATHAIVSHTGGTEHHLFAGTRDDRAKLRTPHFQGAAKAAWSGAIRKVGKPPGRINTAVARVADSASRVRQDKASGHTTGIEATNSIRYIAKIAPQAAAIGIRNATARMEKVHLKALDRSIQQTWRTGRRVVGV